MRALNTPVTVICCRFEAPPSSGPSFFSPLLKSAFGFISLPLGCAGVALSRCKDALGGGETIGVAVQKSGSRCGLNGALPLRGLVSICACVM